MVRPGLINLDFADVETVMSSMGKAMMGTGEAEGEGRAVKAAEAAINNPLIDDYTLKGAKGLLVNITGGKDLKLFEVDEAVNKVRSEVDHEAELIIGAITDPTLDGKMRVSIVATSLDGQQPESKSVINMVHRIQNRNSGYSDITNNGGHQSFNFSTQATSTLTEGANALKLDNEVEEPIIQDSSATNVSINESNSLTEELVESNISNELETNSALDEQIDHQNTEVEENSSNGLENFALEEDTPELFNSDNSDQNEVASIDNTENSEEDDLEIPAFLRRQKN